MEPSHPGAAPPGTGHRWIWLIPLFVVVAVAALIAAFLMGRGATDSAPPATTAASAATTPAVTETVTRVAPTPARTTDPAAHRDLGLKRTLVIPDCDGRVVVFLESIPVTAPDVREQLRRWIEPWEFGPLGAADYLYSQAGCTSLRSVDDNGRPFYAVFVDPGGDVCARFTALRASLPTGAYPRLLSNSVSPGYDPCSP